MPIINVKLKVYGLWSYYESNNLYMKFKQLTIFYWSDLLKHKFFFIFIV